MSAKVLCQPVSGRKDQKAFLDLEKRLYQDDPNWVPPLWSERVKLVGFKHHPFYDDAEGQTFLVRRGDRVVGRVLAVVNHAHNRYHDEKRGFFGFFECEDDEEAAIVLLNTAAEWLKERGMTAVRGPAHPSLNYEVGLLVDGFDTPPTFLIPYNHEYYERLITAAGFEKTQDLYSYEASIDILETLDPKLMFVIEESTRRFNVKCRPIASNNFNADVRVFLDIYNQSLQQTWGYVPMSEQEVVEQSKGLKNLLLPRLTSIAEIEGKPVGAGFGLLDYNPLIKQIGGKLFPFGWLKLLLGRKKLTRLRLVSANVLPEYQKWGLGLVTLYKILPEAIDFGIQMGEFSWVLESNQLSRGTIERGGATRSKTHRLYDRSLTNDADQASS
ncbi:N-acetyltransferase [Rhodopirellula sp. JC740]|uniref:N-acetyltransferase n=1 Tax=Rhodopirellula halodulae TaxID=2894198 RepID=A0ABS8NKR3_9BACT|nr:N-acetyltransferase [Rhodopirellula sp. JC740]MCC9644150.1 N-acetyltransferase [Rhodopirellula sp. JC740]